MTETGARRSRGGNARVRCVSFDAKNPTNTTIPPNQDGLGVWCGLRPEIVSNKIAAACQAKTMPRGQVGQNNNQIPYHKNV